MAVVAEPKQRVIYKRPSRLALARQALVSLAAVLCCYWLYWFLAVPMVEPGVEERTAQKKATDEQIEQARTDVTQRQREVAGYFDEGDWERNNPMLWQRGPVRLLFQEIEPQDDGSVLLKPCTLMIFRDTGGADPARPIIMRAVEGANIRFDQKIVFKTVDLQQRKFVGGVLNGPIRIYQQESAPGAGDDLEITTRDVQMTNERVYTPHPVRFRLGRSHGSGRDMEIHLVNRDGEAATNIMRGAALRSLELKREVRMRLELGSGPLAGETPPGQKPPEQKDTSSPIEITCAGPLRFDMADYAASFHDKVNVFRLRPEQEGDQLNCELLTVYFARPGEASADPAQEAGGGAASQIRLIEARGNPVTLRSPAQGMYARCSGADFLPGPPGSPGELVAFGPGVIRGNIPDSIAGTYVAQWARELRFEPDGELQKAVLRGATVIEFGAMGRITADEVFAWMRQKKLPPGVPKPRTADGGMAADAWDLDRVLAQKYQDPKAVSQGNVVIHGPQLHAEADKLEVTVTGGPAPGGPPAGAAPPPRRLQDDRQRPAALGQRFDVAGRAVRIELVPQGENFAVANATIDQAAKLEQFAPGTGGQVRALLVKGDRLHVRDAHTDATRVTISGQPGYVEASGMSLWGQAIELERRSNHLWIDGSGRLALPLTQDLEGKPLERPQTMTVDWKKRMDFQSDTATFQGTVVARSSQQVVHTERLEAVLTQPVDFGNPRSAAPGGQPDLAAVRSVGKTLLEGRQFDEQGQQQSHSVMEVFDLSIDRTSGDIAAVGPGTVTHVTRGSAPGLPAPPGVAPARPAAIANADDDGMTYLNVRFRKGIRGNIDRREVTFFDHTKTIYGPIEEWNERLEANKPEQLGPSGMMLDAGELTVRQMEGIGDTPGWFELEAGGSVYAEGQQFTAIGERLTYTAKNELLILHGNPAEMYMDDERGGQRRESRAELVKYWFREGRGEVNGARFFNLAVPGDVQRGGQKKDQGKRLPPAARR